MEGEEKKSGSKKRSKAIPVEFDSHDNEPIGALFKLKTKKNPKKVKAELGGNCVKEEGIVIVEDMGGLDDTLASLRKKLKGPKKGSLVFNMSDLSGQPLDGLAEDGDIKVAAEELGKVVDKDELNASVDDGVENIEKGKRSTGVKKVKKNKDRDNQGSMVKLTQIEKTRDLVVDEGSEPDLNNNLEDSLSVLLRDAQSGSIKKSGINSKTKSKSKTQTPKDGKRSNHVPTELQVVDVERSLSSLLVSQKPTKLGKIPTDSTPVHEKIGMNTSSDDHMEDASTPANIDVKIGSSEARDEDPHLISSLKRPQSVLNERSCKILEYEEGVTNKVIGENLGKLDCDGMEYVQKGKSEELLSDKLKNNCSLQNRELTPIKEETRGDHDGFDPPSHDMFQNNCVPNEDDLISSREANGASSPSVSPDRNGNFEEGKGLLPSLKSKDKKLPELLKRKAKKRRHDDMAYEGDVDWDVLIHEQGFAQRPLVEEDELSLKENLGAAAVSAGLKAHVAGPVEKIKFKDILKRKGGHQEYLKCRNQILALWSKDVTRILPLTECGVTASPLVDEPPRDSLTREIYEFLNRSGYINVGIASEKDVMELCSRHDLKLVEEKTSGVRADASDADADDGVSFILGQVKHPESSVAANSNNVLDDNNQAGEATKEKLDTPHPMGESNILESDQYQTDKLHKNISSEAIYHKEMIKLDDVISSSLNVHDNEGVPVVKSEPIAEFCVEQDSEVECVSDEKKRIIVIGAGPAGLTAARHLQRHGFSVNVLEARDRVGGRVYTDRSSLSVPVDLGASIITGVEADVATERRADPSSLVCAQLGLELTVLKSDCPLHDVVTGQKVPANLDEALEAEYNSLLDDMPLLVAQKGERAMKMSLEDGLEYALKGRRMAQSGRSYMEKEVGNFADALVGSEKNSVDGKIYKNDPSKDDVLSPLERRIMNWHFAHLEYGCAALLQDVSLPYWNQDDVYGGFGGAHCMIKGGYSAVVESLGKGLNIHLNHIVTNISYHTNECDGSDVKGNTVRVCTSNGREFSGDAVLITVPLGCLKARDIDFSPPLPRWKDLSIQRLGFGVLNKVVMEFPDVFWDDSVDYFGATAEETDLRGKCFMFWNVKKTVGAPVLIALVVGKAAIEGQKIDSSDLVDHALAVLVKLFGKDVVPEPVASVVTDWGNDPFSYGAYSYVAIGASGEDYDILGRPVENCLFFAGEATCKEYPDTVGGAMLSGLREAVRIIDLMITGYDYTAEVEALEAAQRHLDSERNEVRDIAKRLEAIELSNAVYKNTLDGARAFTRKSLLKDMFGNAKTTDGRLLLAKELLRLPVEALKSFSGTQAGLRILNTWILDSMGKDGTQLLRHCVRILVLVSTDLLAVRLSGVGKTIKEKVCVHTSRDIRAIASQLVNVWIEVFRKEKASNGGLKLLRQSAPGDSLKSKSLDSGKVQPRAHGLPDNKRSLLISASSRSHLPPIADNKRLVRPVKLDSKADLKMEFKSSRSQGSVGGEDPKSEEDHNSVMSEEEKAAFAAAEAAQAAARAAAEAYASSEAKCNTSLPLPKIPSFHKFARREQYTQIDEVDVRKKWSGGTLGRQDCISEIDSRNCRVRDWSVAFPAACAGLENPNNSVDNLSQRSHSNEIAGQLNLREQSGESAAVDSSIFTKAWVDGCGSDGIKDYNAIDRWQSQAAAAESDFYHQNIVIRDEEDSNIKLKPHLDRHKRVVNESSVSQVTVNKDLVGDKPKGAERIKQAVVDFVASLLMPLYKAKKIDRDGYKSIMKKTATKVMEQTTDAEKGMAVNEFLDFKRKNKIRAFVDKLIEKHLGTKP